MNAHASRWLTRRWWRYGALVMVLAVAATLFAMKVMWGYCFQRPGLDPRVESFVSVASITPVATEVDDDGQHAFVVDQDALRAGWGKAIERARADPYYCLDERVLLSLEKRGLLASPLTARENVLRPLYSLVESTGLLDKGKAGYKSATELTGVVVEAAGKDGARYTFVGASGGQVSNDDYPYYEFLFEMPTLQTAKPRLVSYRKFYYDVAGVEGTEGMLMFLVFFPFTLAGCAVLVTVIRIVVDMAMVAYLEFRERRAESC